MEAVENKTYNTPEAEARSIGYLLENDSVKKIPNEDKEPPVVCARLEVLAEARDAQGNNWSKLIAFADRDGKGKRVLLPNRLFASRDGKEVLEVLYNKGLTIRDKKLTVQYLSEYTTSRRALIVNRTGWNGNRFIFSNSDILGESDEMLFYDGEGGIEFNISGTLEDWRDNIGKYCTGNSRLILAVCVAFACPLLEFLNIENGGFHFVGNSRTGKSTALKVACSVYGGADFIKLWRATDNGLEGVAGNRNDALLVLDEIGQLSDISKAGEIAYMLGNGSGKIRSNKNGDARVNKRFRLLFLSSGEKTLKECMIEGKKTLKAGQAIRLLNIPTAQHGLFDELHGKSSGADLSDYLQEQATLYYGTPARAFIEAIIKDGKQTIKADFKDKRQKWSAAYLQQLGKTSGQVNSAFLRFVLAAYAGEYATANGLTGWQKGDALAACMQCFYDWIEQRGGTEDQESSALLEQVKAFFEQNGESQFYKLDSSGEQKVINMAGYKEKAGDDDKYYVLPEAFKNRVCVGFNPKDARKILFAKGWLDCADTITKKKSRVYPFNSKMFESDL